MAKTALLLAGMTALFLGVGYLLGGGQGMAVAFGFACITNFISYWYSDRIVLSMYGAEPLSEQGNPQLYRRIARLAGRAGMPMPKAYVMDNPQPNAFATGRSPERGAIALTTGLLSLLSEREVDAVIAHELGHIRNRDTLIMTVTATLAGAIGMLANVFMLFGGGRGSGRANPLLGLALMILAPLAAMLVQFAISRTREYGADAASAEIAADPAALADALAKISGAAARIPNLAAERNPATAHLFIVNPLHFGGVDNLFSTHPSPENRIRALREMAARMQIRRDAPEIDRRGTFRFG